MKQIKRKKDMKSKFLEKKFLLLIAPDDGFFAKKLSGIAFL